MTRSEHRSQRADDAAATFEDGQREQGVTVSDGGGADADEFRDRYLRLAADFDNFKRRKNQELIDGARYSSEGAAIAVLPVLDNLRRALDHAGDSTEATLADGVRMVVREFEGALERIGVTPIASVGTRFDPAVHEAIGGEASDEVQEDTVVAELQRGYRLHDRVLRPALVRIAHPRHGEGGE